MSILELVRPELLAVRGYSSARMEAAGGTVLLNANESPWASSTDPAGVLQRYPDGQQPGRVLAPLAVLYGVPPECLLIGRGSDECIDLLTRVFCRAGSDAVLIAPPTFAMYRVSAEVQGARIVEVPLLAAREFAYPFDAVRAAALADPSNKLVYICSPNNPTGGAAPGAAVLDLAQALSGRALVVVDEAYVEFADETSLAPRAAARGNLAVLRTLSKAHGLAGARIGALVADPDLIALLRRLMAPYPIPTPSANAAATALAPEAVEATAMRVAALRRERDRLALELARIPAVAHVYPSQANFLTLRWRDAALAYRTLLESGIVVRDVSRYPGLHQCLRVSVGTPAENDAFLRAVAELREAA